MQGRYDPCIKLTIYSFGEVQVLAFLIDPSVPQASSLSFILLAYIHPIIFTKHMFRTSIDQLYREVGLGVACILVVLHSKDLSLPSSSSFEHLSLGHFFSAGFISGQS